MVKDASLHRDDPLEPFETALDAALERLVSARRERDAVKSRLDKSDNSISTLTDLVRNLIAVLPPERRSAYLKQLNELSIVASPQPRSGTVYGNVVNLLTGNPKMEWSASKIQEKLDKTGADTDTKSIHNTLNYLAKTGRLKRVARGCYVVRDLGVGLVTDEEIPGLDPNEGDCGDGY